MELINKKEYEQYLEMRENILSKCDDILNEINKYAPITNLLHCECINLPDCSDPTNNIEFDNDIEFFTIPVGLLYDKGFYDNYMNKLKQTALAEKKQKQLKEKRAKLNKEKADRKQYEKLKVRFESEALHES